MTLSPFLSAPPEIQIHILSACVGLILGPIALYRKKRDKVHKLAGYCWITAMSVLATSALFIPSHFTAFGVGPLHGFALVTLWSLWTGLRAAQRRDIARHESVLRSLYTNALIIAGLFTFLPGRTINRMVFGAPSDLGWIVIAIGFGLIALRFLRPHFGRLSRT